MYKFVHYFFGSAPSRWIRRTRAEPENPQLPAESRAGPAQLPLAGEWGAQHLPRGATLALDPAAEGTREGQGRSRRAALRDPPTPLVRAHPSGQVQATEERSERAGHAQPPSRGPARGATGRGNQSRL